MEVSAVPLNAYVYTVVASGNSMELKAELYTKHWFPTYFTSGATTLSSFGLFQKAWLPIASTSEGNITSLNSGKVWTPSSNPLNANAGMPMNPSVAVCPPMSSPSTSTSGQPVTPLKSTTSTAVPTNGLSIHELSIGEPVTDMPSCSKVPVNLNSVIPAARASSMAARTSSTLIPAISMLPSGAGSFTMTLQVAFLSSTVAVTIAFPAATAVTSPFSSTAAIAVSELSHTMVLLSAFSGSTSAVNWKSSPTSKVISGSFNVTLSTGTGTGSVFLGSQPARINAAITVKSKIFFISI